MSKTVDRKIYFYRVDAGRDENGNQIAFDPVPALEHLDTLPWTTSGRYLDNLDGDATVCWIDSISPAPMMRLGTSRRNSLPHVEINGELSAIPIPDGAGLAEQIHIVFFTNNIVGAVYNFYGPRLSRLKHYLADKAQNVCPLVTFEPLLRKDVISRLDNMEDIRLFQLRLDPPSAAALAKSDSDIGRVLDQAASLGEMGEIEIIFRPKPYARNGSIGFNFLSTAKKLANTSEIFGNHSAVGVRGYNSQTDKIEFFDVLNDKFVVKKAILTTDERMKTLDHRAAYRAIQEAYSELSEELSQAVGIRT